MIGQTFLGRYEVTRLLGEGGMGKVYLARQLDFHRIVVVKVMNEGVASDAKFKDRFERETLLMAKLQHPYVVTLIDASLNDPLGPCIVMEFVRGVTLEAVLGRCKYFSPPRVGRVLGQLCEALQAAHDLSIVHRDLKPSNIMVIDADTPRERIKVMDFGLAKMIDRDKTGIKKVTDTNVDFAVGTPAYISPEQVRGDGVDHRSDVYSVGVMAYEMLAGRLPFLGPHGMDMVLAHATEPPPSFRDIGLDGIISPHIEKVVMACLAKDPEGRPPTASELAERFDLALLKTTEEQLVPVDAEFEVPDSGEHISVPFDDGNIEPPPDDPSALEFQLEAWMPQKIALLKLRGYVQSNNGEIVESVPGLIRVKLNAPTPVPPPNGPMRWLGLRRKNIPMWLDLKMSGNPARENLLQIHARYRPGDTAAHADPLWRRTCLQQFIDLRGFLIGATEVDS